MIGHVARHAGVLGSPIRHSLSPVLHRAAYRALGLAWTYDAYDVDETGLAAFLDGLDRQSSEGSWVGLSLTRPLKAAVLPLLRASDSLVDSTRSANTVLLPARVGYNTDVVGIVRAVRELTAKDLAVVTVVGSGATSRSAVAAAGLLGATEVRIVARRPPPGGVAWADGTSAVADADLVISTVPAGAVPQDWIVDATDQVLLDVVYDPSPTPLQTAWSRAGGSVIGGERMLLHQAGEQVRLMTGSTAPTAAMDAALHEALVIGG